MKNVCGKIIMIVVFVMLYKGKLFCVGPKDIVEPAIVKIALIETCRVKIGNAVRSVKRFLWGDSWRRNYIRRTMSVAAIPFIFLFGYDYDDEQESDGEGEYSNEEYFGNVRMARQRGVAQEQYQAYALEQGVPEDEIKEIVLMMESSSERIRRLKLKLVEYGIPLPRYDMSSDER